jgi:DNA-binding transcriptional regulator YdaS (Cro superfamily)
MKGIELIEALKRRLGTRTDRALQNALGLSSMTLNNWRHRNTLTPRIIAEQIGRLVDEQLSGGKVLVQLQRQLGVKTLNALAGRLGITTQAIQNWKGRRNVTPRQIAGIVKTAREVERKSLQRSAIRPLVEFFPIARRESRQGAKYILFRAKDNKGRDHPYRTGLQEELDCSHGVYIFFDSRGQAIYAGKARRQSLWKEMTAAYNRHRGSVQKIKRASHPARRLPYKTSDEKSRQIRDVEVPLHELASYFSAYEVTDGLIKEIESLLVRSFANDLLNKRMERFSRQRKTKRTTRRKRKK